MEHAARSVRLYEHDEPRVRLLSLEASFGNSLARETRMRVEGRCCLPCGCVRERLDKNDSAEARPVERTVHSLRWAVRPMSQIGRVRRAAFLRIRKWDLLHLAAR